MRTLSSLEPHKLANRLEKNPPEPRKYLKKSSILYGRWVLFTTHPLVDTCVVGMISIVSVVSLEASHTRREKRKTDHHCSVYSLRKGHNVSSFNISREVGGRGFRIIRACVNHVNRHMTAEPRMRGGEACKTRARDRETERFLLHFQLQKSRNEGHNDCSAVYSNLCYL